MSSSNDLPPVSDSSQLHLSQRSWIVLTTSCVSLTRCVPDVSLIVIRTPRRSHMKCFCLPGAPLSPYPGHLKLRCLQDLPPVIAGGWQAAGAELEKAVRGIIAELPPPPPPPQGLKE